MRSGITPALVGLLLCIPCLVPLLLAVGISAGAFSVIGAWLSDNRLVLGAAAAVAVAFVTLAGIVWARRSRAAACATDGRAPSAPLPSDGATQASRIDRR